MVRYYRLVGCMFLISVTVLFVFVQNDEWILSHNDLDALIGILIGAVIGGIGISFLYLAERSKLHDE